MKGERQLTKNNLPRFVLIEGVDGSGKTSLAEKFAKEFGYLYIYPVPEPYRSIRKQIESLYDIEARFWFYLGSNITLQRKMTESFAVGERIVLDRYLYSTFASHKVMGASISGVDMAQLPFHKPDLAILLTCETEVRNKRILDRKIEDEEYVRRQSPILDDTENELRQFPLRVIDTTHIDKAQVFAKAKEMLLEIARQCC